MTVLRTVLRESALNLTNLLLDPETIGGEELPHMAAKETGREPQKHLLRQTLYPTQDPAEIRSEPLSYLQGTD